MIDTLGDSYISFLKDSGCLKSLISYFSKVSGKTSAQRKWIMSQSWLENELHTMMKARCRTKDTYQSLAPMGMFTSTDDTYKKLTVLFPTTSSEIFDGCVPLCVDLQRAVLGKSH